MTDVTVEQFAQVVGITVDRLIAQLDEAGLANRQAGDTITENEKGALLSHLRQRHGWGAEGKDPRRIVLQRKTMSEIKLSVERRGARTTTKTVSVEFRKRRTYVMRSVITEGETRETAEWERRIDPPPRGTVAYLLYLQRLYTETCTPRLLNPSFDNDDNVTFYP